MATRMYKVSIHHELANLPFHGSYSMYVVALGITLVERPVSSTCMVHARVDTRFWEEGALGDQIIIIIMTPTLYNMMECNYFSFYMLLK